jgi:hypothetical protein
VFMNDSGRVLACGHEICFGRFSQLLHTKLVLVTNFALIVDCSLELRNSDFVHNGELCVLNNVTVKAIRNISFLLFSGNGTEQENMRIEREYEMAAAKGFRPCLYFVSILAQLLTQLPCRSYMQENE